jgi:hypothetical protein
VEEQARFKMRSRDGFSVRHIVLHGHKPGA